MKYQSYTLALPLLLVKTRNNGLARVSYSNGRPTKANNNFIDVSMLAVGMYNIQVLTNTGVFSAKFIKQ